MKLPEPHPGSIPQIGRGGEGSFLESGLSQTFYDSLGIIERGGGIELLSLSFHFSDMTFDPSPRANPLRSLCELICDVLLTGFFEFSHSLQLDKYPSFDGVSKNSPEW